MNNIVTLKYLDDYRISAVEESVRSCFADLNIGKILRPKAKVLLKIHAPGAFAPDTAKTSHPDIVRGIVDALTEMNVSVTIIDSPYGNFCNTHLDKVYIETGMLDMANQTKCALNHDLHTYKQEIPEGKRMKSVVLLDALNQADIIINVGKINVDDKFGYFGALHNLFGFVPGDKKLQIISRCAKTEDFNESLLDIYSVIKDKLVLNIIDGVVGLQANGTQKMLSFLAMSQDVFSLDALCQDIIGISYDDTILAKAKEQEYFNPTRAYKLIGEDIERFKTKHFIQNEKEPSLHSNTISQKRMLKKYQTCVKISPKKCKGCGICLKICPVGAISMKYDKNGELYAKVDFSKCIFCNKCVTACPYSVVELKRPLMDKVINKQLEKQNNK